MKVLLLVNGDAPSAPFLKALVAAHDLVIAVDGGANAAFAAGIAPHIVCGDFDSIDQNAQFPCAEFVPLPDQDFFTDLEKALILARARGATSITFTGAMGGRIDHALGSVMVLARYHSEVPLRIAGEEFDLWVVSGAQDFAVTPGDTISLLALGDAIRVTASGLKWNLDRTKLDIGTHGISNVATADTIALKVEGGAVVVCRLSKA